MITYEIAGEGPSILAIVSYRQDLWKSPLTVR
jgi:hypothetical protein